MSIQEAFFHPVKILGLKCLIVRLFIYNYKHQTESQVFPKHQYTHQNQLLNLSLTKHAFLVMDIYF